MSPALDGDLDGLLATGVVIRQVLLLTARQIHHQDPALHLVVLGLLITQWGGDLKTLFDVPSGQ